MQIVQVRPSTYSMKPMIYLVNPLNRFLPWPLRDPSVFCLFCLSFLHVRHSLLMPV